MYRKILITTDGSAVSKHTACAGVKFAQQMGAEVLAACFIIDLTELGGAEKLRKLDVPVRTLMTFEGH